MWFLLYIYFVEFFFVLTVRKCANSPLSLALSRSLSRSLSLSLSRSLSLSLSLSLGLKIASHVIAVKSDFDVSVSRREPITCFQYFESMQASDGAAAVEEHEEVIVYCMIRTMWPQLVSRISKCSSLRGQLHNFFIMVSFYNFFTYLITLGFCKNIEFFVKIREKSQNTFYTNFRNVLKKIILKCFQWNILFFFLLKLPNFMFFFAGNKCPKL